MTHEDTRLVFRIRSGDQGALEDAYRTHAAAVRAVARRVLRDAALADDVAQEVFVNLWRSPQSFDGTRGTLRSYLLMMSHARSVDLIRSEEARAARQLRHAPAPMPVDVEHAGVLSDLETRVRDALAQLPEEERRAVVLAYYGGYSYREVAELEEAPEGTTKSRIRSGMKRLHSTLYRQVASP